MSASKTFIFAHKTARALAAEFCMSAPDGWVARFSEPTRNLEQNAHFHALFSAVAKSGVEWMGKRRTAAQWKVLFVSGHAIATGLGAEIIPGIEGEFVNIRESTAAMSKARGASLIEYVMAWCANNGVKIVVEGK